MASGKFSSPRASRNRDDFPAQDNPADSSCAVPTEPAVKKALPKQAVLALCAVVAVAVLGIGGWFTVSALTDPYDCKIVDGVSLGGVDVGGMSRSEAKKALKAATEGFAQTPMVVELPEDTLTLSPADTKIQVDISAAVRAAYRYGRKNSEAQAPQIPLTPFLKYQQKALRTPLEEYAAKYDTAYQPCSDALFGQMPELAEGKWQENAPCQTLQITMGVDERHLDVDAVMQQILETYGKNQFSLKISEIAPEKAAEKPNLAAISEKYCIPAVNTTLDLQTYAQIPGSYGYGFSMEQAQKLLDKAQPGETVEIPMEYIRPEILGDEAYFRDELGYAQTPHTKDENRNNNLRKACESINGLILQPGEEFSYNATLGQRTRENGYLPAGAYSGTALVQSVGGGICQGSSTLYLACLYADLEIVFRINHGYTSTYIDPGLDATVNWGGPDYQFRNNTHFPIQLKAEVSDGYMKMWILGTEERDYYVKMDTEVTYSADTIYAKSYKCKYDRQTDELISRELEARSNYMRYYQ